MNAYMEKKQYDPKFPIECFSALNNNFLAHWHMEVEMVYVVKGNIKIGINKESRILHEGSIAIFSSTDIHYYDSTNLTSEIIVLIFKPQAVGVNGNWPEKAKLSTPFIDKDFWKDSNFAYFDEIKNIFTNMLEEITSKKPYYQLYVRGRLLELCSLLQRHLPSYKSDEYASGQKLRNIERIQEVLKYLENQYSKDISLESLSEMVNLNPSYFSRMFKEFIGINFKEYLSRIRIEKAENLILTTDTPIIDICFQCGFNSVRTFNRIFKAVNGCTPSVLNKAL